MTTALLPMKLNSERVPGKNFRPLGGRPLFAWMLDSLLDCPSIDLVVINTDASDRLYEAGLRPQDRLLIRERPEHLLGDFTSMNRIIEDDIAAVAADTYLMTHATNPFVSTATIEAALHAYQTADCDSLFSVNKVQTRFYGENGSAVNHDPTNLVRTQDLEPWFEENSCIYVFSRQSFKSTGARIGKSPHMFEIPALEAVDIDEPKDWILAEALAGHFRGKQP